MVLSSAVRTSVKNDRAEWLNRALASGDWHQIRKLRKRSPANQGRLRDSQGKVVSSEERAETLAEYLESIQWAVRPASIVERPRQDNSPLPVLRGPITEPEVITAASALKNNRAVGLDDVPGEFWKAVLTPGSYALRQFTLFCNTCWTNKEVPDQWHESRVVMLFKKGDPASCENYRPISLLCIAYKLFANILLRRLRDAGAEDRIWRTQFGFRSSRGTCDALFIARRELERANSEKHGKSVFLALDWAKAFDSVSPDGLSDALSRFGLPESFVDMIQAIYSKRCFIVSDAGARSRWHNQRYGICQGCPLSPFLFVVLMTVLLQDAKKDLQDRGVILSSSCLCNELVYADDTLLIDVDDGAIEQFMDCVGKAGAEYGLTFNWKKLEAMAVNTVADIQKPDKSFVKVGESMVYLGSLLTVDGHADAEVGRRIGMAKTDFECLQSVWSHAGLSTDRKLRILDACMTSKLLYGLHTAYFGKVQTKRLDGFYARCLRRVLHIPSAYESRISNDTVYKRARRQKLSVQLLERQLHLFAELAQRFDDDPVRCCIFEPGSVSQRARGRMGRGRPRTTWADHIFKIAVQVAGSSEVLTSMLAPRRSGERAWRAAVKRYLFYM